MSAFALAAAACRLCHGSGYRIVRGEARNVCGCVWRAVNSDCVSAYHQFDLDARFAHADPTKGMQPIRYRFGHPPQEWRADFEMLARRVLSRQRYMVFKLFFLDGRDWRDCCSKIGLDKGNFFHRVYECAELIGRAVCAVRPHALYPVGQYLSSGNPAPARSRGLRFRIVRTVMPIAKFPITAVAEVA